MLEKGEKPLHDIVIPPGNWPYLVAVREKRTTKKEKKKTAKTTKKEKQRENTCLLPAVNIGIFGLDQPPHTPTPYNNCVIACCFLCLMWFRQIAIIGAVSSGPVQK